MMCRRIFPVLRLRSWRLHAGHGIPCAMPTGCASTPLKALSRGLRHKASPPSRQSGLWLSLVSVTTGPALVRYARGQDRVFIALMSTIGLLCSWLGTLCWNRASQRLPTALAGQLIVFETLAGLTYAFLLRQEFPSLLTMIGVMILMLGY